ncbi:hypothetical protein H7K45_09770 [Mycobacterium yunnanensis]|uniref:Membrane protein involved in the export of O-antigen and teichoic acid n=1 Tax=Mycobacterium yunnanensis TaxID=368477 RepID=A0A9X2YZC7_9MYCO|nr:hypothetical protein [Mycobacterium yunnanensis]MCV7420824.1 hypothetical protein [Mycobacterium yunnanensis]
MTVEPQAVEGVAGARFGVRRVQRDAAAMAVASLVNSVLGASFWAFSAKFISPADLGVMTAVLAVILSAVAIVSTGVGDAYTALLPAVGPARGLVYRHGQRVFFALISVTAVVGAVGCTMLLREVRGSWGVAALVAVGIVVWGTWALQNSTVAAVGRAQWLPVANIAVGIGKIVILPLLAFTLSWHSVELAVVISGAALVAILWPRINQVMKSNDDLPSGASISEDRAVSEFNRLVVRTVALCTLGLGLLLLTPFLVTVYAGPSQGALFALSVSLVTTLDFIGASMSVSLVVHASGSPEDTRTMARTILIRSGAVTLAGVVVLIAVVPAALRFLNPQYGQMGAFAVIAVLCASTLARVPYLVWAAWQQSRRNLRMPLIFNAFTAALMLAILPVLCRDYGALGGAVALLVHQVALTAAAGVQFMVEQRRTG